MNSVIKKVIFPVFFVVFCGSAKATTVDILSTPDQCDIITEFVPFWYGTASCDVYVNGILVSLSEEVGFSTSPTTFLSYTEGNQTYTCTASLPFVGYTDIQIENCPPVADIGVRQKTYGKVNEVLFYSTSTDDGAIVGYKWYIDGTYYGDRSIVQFYTTIRRTVEVKLEVTDDSGKTDIVVESVTLSAPTPCYANCDIIP